jgi:hypothetical protein
MKYGMMRLPCCLVLLTCLAACSSVRSGYRTMRNDEREGTKAPDLSTDLDLADVVWVNGSAADLRGGAEWTAFVFFKPN